MSSTRGRQSSAQRDLGGCGVVGISFAKTLILKEKDDQNLRISQKQ